MDLEKWREFIKNDLEGIKHNLGDFLEYVNGYATENQSYFRDFNSALYKIKQRVLWGNVTTCLLLGLILWRVW